MPQTLPERFAALPETAQRQLIRISRIAAGMSTDEKLWAQSFLAGITAPNAFTVDADGVEALQMISALMVTVAAFDDVSGDAATGLRSS